MICIWGWGADSHNIAQDNLKIMILLPLLSHYWGYWCVAHTHPVIRSQEEEEVEEVVEEEGRKKKI